MHYRRMGWDGKGTQCEAAQKKKVKEMGREGKKRGEGRERMEEEKKGVGGKMKEGEGREWKKNSVWGKEKFLFSSRG